MATFVAITLLATSILYILSGFSQIVLGVLSLIPTNILWVTAAVYACTYYLFGFETVGYDGADTTPNEPPSQEVFFALFYKPLLALVYEDCIVCREEPVTPVQVSCGHVFCDEHIREWFDRGNNRCPQCTKVLFVDSNTRFEKLVKLFIAMNLVSAFATALLIVFASNVDRMLVVLGTCVGLFNAVSLAMYQESRKRYRGRWWRHYELLSADDDESEQTVVLLSGLLFGWLWTCAGYLT